MFRCIYSRTQFEPYIETMLYGFVTRDNAIRLRHVEPARVLLRHAVPSPLQLPDSLHRLAKEQSRRPPISYLDTLVKTGSESTEATLRRRRILFARFVACMEDTRLPKCVMFGELVWGAGCAGEGGKRVDRVFPGRPQSLRHQRPPVDWMTAAQDEGKWRRGRNF